MGSVFYEKVLKLCSKTGISPSALAIAVGKGTATATGWKNGAVPRADTIRKIADHFGVTPDFLTTGEEAPEELSYLSPNEVELIRIFRNIPIKQQTEIMSIAYSMEDQPYQIAARGGAGILQVTDKVGKVAIDNLFDSVDRKKDDD